MTKADVIRPYVEKVMKELLGIDELLVWDDGTIPVRVGSAGVYVRLAEPGDEALLHVYSPLLRNVSKTPELLERLNELNASTFQARAFWLADQVVVAVDLLAETLDKDEVRAAVDLVSSLADRWDTELQGRFGGETVFAQDEEDPNQANDAGVLPPPPPTTAPDTDADDGDPPAHGYL
jgi:Putative bacterial sensory transduction regulator